MTPDWLSHFLTVIAGAGGVYAAIRADMAYLKAKAEQACTDAVKAHDRLDMHIENYHTTKRG